MSGNADDEKEPQKVIPLDLARSQITSIRTVEGAKAPLVMTSQSLRGMRVLTQNVPQSVTTTTPSNGPTIISTQPLLKQGEPAQVRPAQITLSTASLMTSGTSYHVPRGPAVVANLAAPRSNVTTVRTPMVVAQTGQTFIRPPRTPSPASNTAWLNPSNGSQIKGAPTVLSSPVRGATVTGKQQLVTRTPQTSSPIRPGAILQNAITIGNPAQLHSFKTAPAIQTLGNTVTIAQVLPARTQAVVYNTSNTSQFAATTRISVANSPQQSPRQTVASGRPINQVTAARLTVPVNVTQAPGTRLVPPQATVLTTGARIPAQSPVLSTSLPRIATTQPSVTIGRLSVATASPNQVTTAMGPRISTLNLVAVANAAQPPRNIQAQGAKVIAQPAAGTIHLTSLQAPIKTTHSVATTTATRALVTVPPSAIVTQRPTAVVPTQAISITKVFPQESANVFIHSSNTTASSPTNLGQPTINTTPPATTTSPSVSTTTTYTLPTATYFYDATGNNYSVARNFTSQTGFPATPQVKSHVQGIVANPQMRFNSVMVVDANARSQPFAPQSTAVDEQQLVPTKMTSSPRPSILRKRDHEGSPLKAAKNLTHVLASMPSSQSAPLSPPSRPDSHSSGGSTTISATSSPGLAELNEDSMPHVPMNNKDEEEVKPVTEMSPRKKPRKQQLTGSNDLDENNDDMEFISESMVKKEAIDESDGNASDEQANERSDVNQVATLRKPATASLLNSYRQTWKATHNHYLRYSDVKPKDERRPSIMDLANQYRVQDKVNGWKIHHLSTQMEDLADQEEGVYSQLTDLLKFTESQDKGKLGEDVNRINELIKGNLQRIKIINDGMIEAKTQIMKIFDHKVHVMDIINRCASKRNFKKREKL